MKERKLQIPVRCTTRKFYLMRPPKGRNDWHVCFAPPNGRPARVFRSTGTNNVAAAKQIGAQIIESFWTDAGRAAETLKQRSGFALLSELLERYQPLPNDVKAEVATKNRSAFRVVVRDGLGAAAIDGLRCDVLTGDLARQFLANRELRVAASDEIAKERARVSANSTLAQARSVVSPKALGLYAGLRLSDFAEFRAAARLRTDSGYYRYQPVSDETLAAIEADAQRIKGERPLLYRAYLLMRYLGLRPSEVWPARWSWIDRGEFVLERRGDFFTKNRKYRRVPIAPELLRELNELRAGAMPQAWIINLPTVTERRDLMRYELNAWLRRFIPRCEHEKCSYVLRKHAGSVIADRDGIEAAADFLGDSIAVTERHYRGQLRRGRGIEYKTARADETRAVVLAG